MVEGVEVATLTFIPPLVCGAVIGLYEAFLVNKDVSIPTHKFGHMISAAIKALVFTFFCFNVPLLYALVPQLKTIFLLKYEVAVRIAIGLIAAIGVHGSSAAFGGSSGGGGVTKETWLHSFTVGALIVAAPYLWPLIAPVLPSWLGGSKGAAPAVVPKK